MQMLKKIQLLLVISLSFFTASMTFGQQANVWQVGSNITIDFNKTGTAMFGNGIAFLPPGNHYESSSTISNNSGTLSFDKFVVENRFFEPKMYLYPIPNIEILKSNGVLTQNPGW